MSRRSLDPTTAARWKRLLRSPDPTLRKPRRIYALPDFPRVREFLTRRRTA